MTDYPNYNCTANPAATVNRLNRHVERLNDTDNSHSEFVNYIFDNLEVLKNVLEKDKALSNMLRDMIEAARPTRPFNSPTKIRMPPTPKPVAPRRPRWGDED